MDIDGPAAVVIGGGSGPGEAVALELARTLAAAIVTDMHQNGEVSRRDGALRMALG